MNRRHNTEWRVRFAAALEKAGVKCWPTEGNFILADFGTAARASAADAFLKSRGIIVRAMGAYDLPHCLRLTVGTAEECGIVADAVSTFMATQTANG
jgi:histidinol-phosphate aminotransferase